MNCPQCGLEVPEKSNFCEHCGKPLSVQGKTQEIAVTNVAQPTAADPSLRPASPQAGASQPERMIWQEYPSFRTAYPPLIGASVIYAVAAIVTHRFTGNMKPVWMHMSLVQALLLAVFVIVLLGIVLHYYVRLRSTKYRLSSQRIFVERGLLSKRTDEVELEKYRDIFVNQDFWDRMVGCGDVRVVTGDVTNQTVEIVDVLDPVRKKEMIRTAARERQAALGVIRREDL